LQRSSIAEGFHCCDGLDHDLDHCLRTTTTMMMMKTMIVKLLLLLLLLLL
jgi:hypothetical protein